MAPWGPVSPQVGTIATGIEGLTEVVSERSVSEGPVKNLSLRGQGEA